MKELYGGGDDGDGDDSDGIVLVKRMILRFNVIKLTLRAKSVMVRLTPRHSSKPR